MYARSVPKPAHWVLKSFAQLGASGLGGALRAPLGPVAAPLASSLRAPSRPHPPRDGGFALCTRLRLRMCFSCTTRRRKLRAEAAASTYAGGRPGSECAARNERSNERGRGAAGAPRGAKRNVGSPEPGALYYTNLIKSAGYSPDGCTRFRRDSAPQTTHGPMRWSKTQVTMICAVIHGCGAQM